jgi:hypothetical protein
MGDFFLTFFLLLNTKQKTIQSLVGLDLREVENGRFDHSYSYTSRERGSDSANSHENAGEGQKREDAPSEVRIIFRQWLLRS